MLLPRVQQYISRSWRDHHAADQELESAPAASGEAASPTATAESATGRTENPIRTSSEILTKATKLHWLPAGPCCHPGGGGGMHEAGLGQSEVWVYGKDR